MQSGSRPPRHALSLLAEMKSGAPGHSGEGRRGVECGDGRTRRAARPERPTSPPQLDRGRYAPGKFGGRRLSADIPEVDSVVQSRGSDLVGIFRLAQQHGPRRCEFSNASVGHGTFDHLDLRHVIGLDTLTHIGPSSISITRLPQPGSDSPSPSFAAAASPRTSSRT
jgi:hypothetical protein